MSLAFDTDHTSPEIAVDQIDHQQIHGQTVFPLLFVNQSQTLTSAETLEWVRKRDHQLLQTASEHGAVLFRGFPLKTAEDFDAFVVALGLNNFPYKESLSNAVRLNRTERVFSANEAPPEVDIFFHHEMAQTPVYPAMILFFCEIAAEEGGATPICRSDILYERLKQSCPEFLDQCEQLGLRYTNVMPANDDPLSGMGRSWKSTLNVTTQEQAELRLKALNYTWEWMPDDCLRVTSPVLPAVMEISLGRRTFFNQLIAAYRGWKDSRNDPTEAIRFGDGSRLDTEAVMKAVEISEELAFDVAWQPGDVVLIDNTVVMHARRTFRGTRKVLASLANPQTQIFSPL